LDKIVNFFDFGGDKKFQPDFRIEQTLPATHRSIISQYQPESRNRIFKNMAFFDIGRIFGTF